MEGAAGLRPLRGRPACSGRRKPPITAPGSPAGRLHQESGGVDSSSWWRNPRERRDRRGARLTRRVREEYLVSFDRNATMSGAKRRGSAGMDRRPNAAWVSLPVVGPGWIAGRAPTGRTGPRGFHHRLLGRDGSPAEPPPGELGRVGFTIGCWCRIRTPARTGWCSVRPPFGL